MTGQNARGTLLETLRLARGLTQSDLSDATGISQAALSKVESGNATLDDDKWTAIADLLHVPLSAFSSARGDVKPARVFHRKQKTTPMAAVRRIGADASLTRLRLDDLLGAVPIPALEHHDLEDGFVTPQEVAQSLRRELGIGTEPIADLIALVESTGALVLRWPLESLKVDAIAAWPEDAAPVILVSDQILAERLRFTVAHELGHAVMHRGDATEIEEHEADAFASEFLLPGDELRRVWPSSPTVDNLTPIKRLWGVSLSALVRRGFDLGLIDEREYRLWNIRMSTSGMHRTEPNPIAPEQPRALKSAIQIELDKGATIDELADRAHMHVAEFMTVFMEETA